MRIYELKIDKPVWFYEPPTFRQIKVLKFFGKSVSSKINKGVASGIIFQIFKDDSNKELWIKYLYHTDDICQDSPDLLPFDLEELKLVKVPEDWKPPRGPRLPNDREDRMRQVVCEIMRDGSPFDEPVPAIEFVGRSFVFTGKFTSATRPECQAVVESLGAKAQKSVTQQTDYLVIGAEGSGDWAEGTHGRKIEKAMILRMNNGKPAILSESDWLVAMQELKGS